jgi:hypothetical protein
VRENRSKVSRVKLYPDLSMFAKQKIARNVVGVEADEKRKTFSGS